MMKTLYLLFDSLILVYTTYRISPIPIEKRIDKRIYQMFTIWFSTTFNILTFSTGSSGPVFFSLSIKDSLLVILVVNVMYVPPTSFTLPF